MWRWVSFFWVLTPLALGTLSFDKADLQVSVHQLTPKQGTLRWALFDNTQAFELRNPALKSGSIPVSSASLTWNISGLEPGQYALAVYQDLNNNGQLDLNFLGVPKEPYAFSGTGKLKWRPPNFETAAVYINRKTHIKITLP